MLIQALFLQYLPLAYTNLALISGRKGDGKSPKGHLVILIQT